MKRCPKCGETKSLTEFRLRNDPKRTVQTVSRCKPCTTQAMREWVLKNPNYEKERYQRDKVKSREKHLLRKYRVSLQEYDRLKLMQGGVCAICDANEADQPHKVFHVDHCHKTGVVRGLLCAPCNQMLGAVDDNAATLKAAILYLERRVSPQIPELIGRAILAWEHAA